jgi:hypothetical protein
MFESWRGVVGDIKPTYRPGSLEDFIRLLPEGIGVIPLTVGIRSGTEQSFALQVPVIYNLATKLWDVQKRFHVREPVKGYGRLLEELP